MKTAFLIAGTASGVGKTTVTLAILAAMRRRGLRVQPFKGGPDFLDTTHHSRIAGRPSRNLDTWLLSAEANRTVFAATSADVDAAVVEGMMGLFDGKSASGDQGSSAEIAKLLGLPVLLVVDAAKSARSAAATVLGFELFDPALSLAGVILNRVGSPGHLAMLTEAIRSRCRTPVLGSLPRTPEIAIPERHLGLHAAVGEMAGLEAEIERLASMAEEHFDLERILQIQQDEVPQRLKPELGRDRYGTAESVPSRRQEKLRIGIARDAAFSFYYQDNLDLLEQHGAELVPFSPLTDAHLPPDLDALYLGGGYPELHADTLSRNQTLLSDLRAFAAADRPIYAECGGMLYLAETLRTAEGLIPLSGVLPLRAEMTPRLVNFGYVTVTFTRDCLLGPAGTAVRGHSFHYSRLEADPALQTAYSLEFSLSGRTAQEGYTRGNILASYVHLHFRGHPGLVPNLLASIGAAARTRQQVFA